MQLARALAIGFAALAVAALAGCGDNEAGETNAVVERSFAKDVKPILDRYCVSCHKPGGPGYAKSGFSVASYADLMKGTKNGPVIQPGASYASTLQILIEHKADPDIAMPQIGRKLDDHEIQIIGEWIDQGAKDN